MKKTIFFITVLLMPFSFLYAETVTMKNGTVYKGNIHLDDGQKVYIVQDTDLIELKKSDIEDIKEDAPKKNTGIFSTDKDVPEEKNLHEIIFKLGYDFYGEYRHKSKTNTDSSPAGINFSAEYFLYVNNFLGIGAGTLVQSSRNVSFIPGKFYFVPVYLGIRLRSQPVVPYKYGYATAHIGYNMIFMDSLYDDALADEKGGLYYAAGIGIVYQNIAAEFLISVNNGKAKYKYSGTDIDIEYLKYSVSVGYVFDI